jgi:ribosomal protein L21
LEVYQKNFLNFICGIPTSIEALDKDEEVEVRPNKTIQEEEMQIEESQNLKGKKLKRNKYRQKNHKTSEEGARRKKTIDNLKMRASGNYSSNKRRGIQNTTIGNINTY